MSTKDRFLRASGQLFRSRGYSGTGLKQIVAVSGAPWGSMYHFFPDGKEQLGAETVRYAGALDNEQIRSSFARAHDPVAAVRNIFKSEMRRLKASDFADGCPVATVATDVAATSERVREACSDAFSSWEETIADALVGHGVARPEAQAAASCTLSALEGATLLSRTHKSTKPMRHAMEMAVRIVSEALSDAAGK